MKSAAVVALALIESADAFQAPAIASRAATKAVSMFSEGDIGVLPPLGVYDPLGLIETRDMFRYEIMEIKHGRAGWVRYDDPEVKAFKLNAERQNGRAAMLGIT